MYVGFHLPIACETPASLLFPKQLTEQCVTDKMGSDCRERLSFFKRIIDPVLESFTCLNKGLVLHLYFYSESVETRPC